MPFPAASTASPAGCGADAHSAASASTRPQPEELFGGEPLGVPPHVCPGLTVTGAQVEIRKDSIESGSPLSCGFAERNSAATPATCGAAMLVPLSTVYVLVGELDRTLTPGAL